MRIQTILNRVEKFKSFVYGEARLEERDGGPALVVQVRPRKNGRPSCSGCGRPGPAYDRLEERRFEFVPVWGIVVFLAYRMRRVDCKRCGVTVEMVPWCDGKNQLTTTYRWFLATWAKRLSWSEVASIFRTSWDSVCRAVDHAVEWGLAHRDLSGLTAVGVDEVAWSRGHTYLTLVYDIGGGRTTAVGRGRGADGGEPAFVPGRPRRAGLRAGAVRVQRHVEAVPQRDRRAARPGGPRAGPVPRHAEVRQGAGRDPGGGGEAAEAGRLRAGLEAVAVVLPEAAGEPDGQADGEAVGAVEVQPADGAGVPAAGGVPAALGVQECVAGRGGSWTSGRAG